MESGSPKDIADIAESMIQKGQRAEPEKLLINFVSEMPPDWKPVTISTTSIDIAYWSIMEFMSYAPHYDQGGSKKTINWVYPSYSKAFYLLAFLYVEREDWPKASWCIDQAFELEPDHPLILCEKAMICSFSGRHQEAYDLFIKAADIRSWIPSQQRARALRGAATVLIDMERLDEAEDFLKKSLEVEPENENTLHELVYIEELRRGCRQRQPRVVFQKKLL